MIERSLNMHAKQAMNYCLLCRSSQCNRCAQVNLAPIIKLSTRYRLRRLRGVQVAMIIAALLVSTGGINHEARGQIQQTPIIPDKGFEGTAPSIPSPVDIPPLKGPLPPQLVSPDQNGTNTTTPTLLGLVQAFDESLLKHPRVGSIRSQLGLAQAQYAQALTLPNPSFTLYQGMRAEQTYQRGVSVPVEPAWKIVTRVLLAKRMVKQADLEILAALWALRSDVRRAYVETVVAQETVETLSDLKTLSERLLSVAHKRFQAGDVPELDALKARLATSQAEIDFNQGLRRVTQAKQQLNIMLGRKYAGDIDVHRLPVIKGRVETSDLLPNFDQPLPSSDDFVLQALETRLELKIINQQIKVANAGVSDSIGNIIPNFQINVGNSATGNPPNGPKIKNGYYVGISQELPVLNLQQGPILRLQAQIKQLRFETLSQKNVITAQTTAAYQRLLAARERIKSYRDHVLDDSNEVARLARRSYEVGQSDITSTLAAQQANIQVRSQYLDAVQAYQLAYADLEQALGKPLQ